MDTAAANQIVLGECSKRLFEIFSTNLVGDVGEHYDDVNVALEDHLPEVGHRLRERTLTGDEEPLLVADSR